MIPSIRRTRPAAVFPGAGELSKTAALMIPFYRKIARDERYALQWSAAVRKADLTRMLRLFRQTVPLRNPGLSTSGIGYFLDVEFPAPLQLYTNGTSQRPGSARFQFSTKAHRTIARAVLPLYRTMRDSRPFTRALAEAIRRGNRALVERLVRSRVHSRHLHSVTLIESGFAMGFRIPGVNNTYFNEFFRGFTG
ncbi:hypothetical protein FE783_07870 [Paenibacillus mesophilus]|uniref:hypothetical protein n=1 Tax=Paenibacillus mesophilus TaxID=2582849 RepID=UPI00110E3D3A|nr:hypothetical protein [Paenibacillus mesophilus]TMV50606.1 hypothetical protein FE783_07870 [Paenibacillus mesophilus]